MSVLRRRIDPPPLSRNLVDEDGTDPFEAFVIVTPCFVRVSNDPIDPNIFADDPCSITRYECTHGIPSSDLLEVQIEFDYELHYRPAGNFTLTVESLETNILNHLASLSGLVNCPTTSTARRRDPPQRRALQPEFDPKEVLILDSAPLDIPDPNVQVGACIVPVQETEVRGAICQPMKGSLSATIRTDNATASETSIQSGVSRIVREGMLADTYVYGNIQKVSFIGERTPGSTTGVAEEEEQSPKSGGGGGLSSAGVALVSVGSVCLFLLLATLLLLARKRKRKGEGEDKAEMVDSAGLEDDIQPRSIDHPDVLLPPPVVASDSFSSSDPSSMAAHDTLALKPQDTVRKTSEFAIDDETASLSTSSRSAGSPIRPPQNKRRKKKKKSPQRLSEQELLQTLDSIAEHPHEEVGATDSESANGLPNIA